MQPAQKLPPPASAGQPLQQGQAAQSSGHRSHHKGKRSRAAESAWAVGTYRSSCGSMEGLINGSKSPRNRRAARTEKLFSAEKQKAARAGALCCLRCPLNTRLHLLFSQWQSRPSSPLPSVPLCSVSKRKAGRRKERKKEGRRKKKGCYKSQRYTLDDGRGGFLCLFLFVSVCVACLSRQ